MAKAKGGDKKGAGDKNTKAGGDKKGAGDKKTKSGGKKAKYPAGRVAVAAVVLRGHQGWLVRLRVLFAHGKCVCSAANMQDRNNF
ncbi:hypothetical protein FBU59_002278 [Linderina macrospora]|uniref:Uncharacterized protein n=1 Tax=Linderina macrospora TaxID=4868 RepID=A0ACC1JBT6_9FUNG|nr:hypothetical protein FBU59_002278 [Linderina macrospora]